MKSFSVRGLVNSGLAGLIDVNFIPLKQLHLNQYTKNEVLHSGFL